MGVREFVIADTHFNHANIIKYEDRPFNTVEEMNGALINNWNSIVKERDKIYVLGDFAFGNLEYIEELISNLNGYKVLIMGNHDRRIKKSSKWWIDRGFNEASKYPIIKDNKIVMQHEPALLQDMIKSNYTYLYGHVHSASNYKTVTSFSACVCVERWDYKPVLLSKLIKEIEKTTY